MTSAQNIARHRAEAPKTSSLAMIAKAVSGNAGTVGRQAAVIAAASGLVLTSGIAANAADTKVDRESTSTSTLDVQAVVQSTIAADSTVDISYERPVVTTVQAPPPVEKKAPAAEAKAETKATATTTASTSTANVAVSSAAPAAAKAPAASSGIGAAIAAAAYAQLGVTQDCTMLVTNSLAAVGIHFHDWPAGYLSLGRTVSAAEAQPGDLAYYANGGLAGQAHIAVYVGNGMAVHGGWNGSTTALFSVNVGSGPVFIRVNG
ncbi:NlpC/P60 family protein [Paenarthrobacter ilicis]|uniref:Cell wall-associated NlpC family hydrolase n=1 Tax=Paenarthrobacter ilicis TaxID=43665 RepID=A0ABX0TDT9_9MICC|nr:NlpC/P60 family protein [Paenarthrobacter ilicis]MBM7792313.1 cell wall-associated NlpC family hydrolase [Paenarthrobacter ilicis]NIJ00657.1 cell wall-associated NlpC family hydrolase [Paenarthrobacter ilicis]